jgi:hypothetical protein
MHHARRVRSRVIYLEPEAPIKPASGDVCNGCGVCCLSEPCPLGAILSGRRSGPCDWVRWDAAGRRYRCSVADGAASRLPSVPRAAVHALEALARRWIAAGQGCDCDLEVGTSLRQPHERATPSDAAHGPRR